MLRNFMENCYFVVKKFLFSADPFIRTGALYVLYALYYKQPVKRWVKIRLTQLEVDKINELLQIHLSKKFLQTTYVYKKMCLDNAFLYCALVQSLGIDEKTIRRHDLSAEEIYKQAPSDNPVLKLERVLNDDSILPDLEKTDREYQELMQKYKQKCSYLTATPSNISADLRTAYEQVLNVNFDEEDEGGASRVSRVKKKAMGGANAVYRCDRKVTRAVDQSQNEEQGE